MTVFNNGIKVGFGGHEAQISAFRQKMHEGDAFIASVLDTEVDIDSPKYFLIDTTSENQETVVVFSIVTSNETIIEVFEEPTISNNGSSISLFNQNRASSKTTNILCYEDPTVSDDGTEIFIQLLGSSPTNQSQIGALAEFNALVLDVNQKYIIKVTPSNNDTKVNFMLRVFQNCN